MASDRVFPKDLLLDAGFAPEWVTKYCGNVSSTYYHHVMQGVGMRKDALGAVYTEADAAGLLAVARGMRDNPGGTARPEKATAVCDNSTCSLRWMAHAGPCE